MKLLIVIFIPLYLFTSCATLFTGISDDITIRTDPPGATIFVDGIKKGKTPETLRINRPGVNQTWISLHKEGYQATHFVLEKEFNKMFYLNLTYVFVPIPYFIDLVSGSVYIYSIQEYDINLKQERDVELD